MKIAVIGAGLSGLRATQLLESKKYEVTLYEARERIGGRVFSQNIFSSQVESGAEWIDRDHLRVLAWMRSLGVEPRIVEDWPGLISFKNQICDEKNPWHEVVDDQERIENALAESQHESVGELIDEVCQSERGKFVCSLIVRSDEGEDPEHINLDIFRRENKNYENRESNDMSCFKFPLPSSDLLSEMQLQLKSEIRLESPVQEIQMMEDQIAVLSKNRLNFYDAVVITCPPPTYKKIRFEPAQLQLTAHQHAQFPMARVVKVHLRFRNAFWQEMGWKRLLTDLDCMQVWESDEENPALTCYICGEKAHEIRVSGDPIMKALKGLSEFAPQAEIEFLGGELVDWVGDEWAGGAFISCPPEISSEKRFNLPTNFERVYFAGDHMSSWPGFMEGALESAELVVERILDMEKNYESE